LDFFAIGKGGWPSKVWWETRHAVKAELPTNSTSTVRVTETPPDVRITGYVFLNSAHGTMGLNR